MSSWQPNCPSVVTLHSGLKPHTLTINTTLVFWELSGETDLRAWPAVSIAGPQQCDQVEAEESAQQCQHHVVLGHGGKQLRRARYVHVVRHHEEGAPEESEVVAQTLCLVWSAFLSHLTQREHIPDVQLVELITVQADPEQVYQTLSRWNLTWQPSDAHACFPMFQYKHLLIKEVIFSIRPGSHVELKSLVSTYQTPGVSCNMSGVIIQR